VNGRRFDTARVSLAGDRPSNQDRATILTQQACTLLCLADGLGGHPRGEVAAQLAVDVCESLFRQTRKPLSDPQRFMLQCAQQAHHAIITFGQRQHPAIWPRTTLVVAVVQPDGVHWVHVGDSRFYLLRESRVQARTHDHADTFRVETIDKGSAVRAGLTRCLGGRQQPPPLTAGPSTRLRDGDLLLLCSDGLWNPLSDDELLRILLPAADLQQAVNRLADMAQSRAHPHSDNITALALRWHTPATDTVPLDNVADDSPETGAQPQRGLAKTEKSS
jgi:PPM family protein phosphatase